MFSDWESVPCFVYHQDCCPEFVVLCLLFLHQHLVSALHIVISSLSPCLSVCVSIAASLYTLLSPRWCSMTPQWHLSYPVVLLDKDLLSYCLEHLGLCLEDRFLLPLQTKLKEVIFSPMYVSVCNQNNSETFERNVMNLLWMTTTKISPLSLIFRAHWWMHTSARAQIRILCTCT